MTSIRRAAIMLLWQRYKITYEPIVTIAEIMAQDENMSFQDALEDWAISKPLWGTDYCWPASRWRSEICYRLLKAGEDAPGGLEQWFDERAKEVRRIANRVRA